MLLYFTACFLQLKQSLGCTWSPLSPLQWSQSHILDTQNPLSTKTIKHCYITDNCAHVWRTWTVLRSALYTKLAHKSVSADYQMDFRCWKFVFHPIKRWKCSQQFLLAAPVQAETVFGFSGSLWAQFMWLRCEMFTLVASHGLNSNNRRGTHAMEKSFNCKLAHSEGSHVTSTPLMPVLCWPPAKPPLRLRCRQGRFYKWKRESFHFTPTPPLYCENLLCAERNHIISTHTLDICHYATRCCNKTSNWIILKTVKFGGAGGNPLQESRSVRAPGAGEQPGGVDTARRDLPGV